ncbi:hypothetical protein SAMN05444392_101894 [Seinonella peptonophila]|uniref:Uncharacterized protein n=1 Tax=Seinonella peptonophila TaxID=112248 RepID=A0A1M4U9T4_9BACL|nr:hypothetical protein [Seinonella peptonophila]SHE53601.1 hypothetical protein SAMN05444392_101894 [Seinonella peptonophila]
MSFRLKIPIPSTGTLGDGQITSDIYLRTIFTDRDSSALFTVMLGYAEQILGNNPQIVKNATIYQDKRFLDAYEVGQVIAGKDVNPDHRIDTRLIGRRDNHPLQSRVMNNFPRQFPDIPKECNPLDKNYDPTQLHLMFIGFMSAFVEREDEQKQIDSLLKEYGGSSLHFLSSSYQIGREFARSHLNCLGLVHKVLQQIVSADRADLLYLMFHEPTLKQIINMSPDARKICEIGSAILSPHEHQSADHIGPINLEAIPPFKMVGGIRKPALEEIEPIKKIRQWREKSPKAVPNIPHGFRGAVEQGDLASIRVFGRGVNKFARGKSVNIPNKKQVLLPYYLTNTEGSWSIPSLETAGYEFADHQCSKTNMIENMRRSDKGR